MDVLGYSLGKLFDILHHRFNALIPGILPYTGEPSIACTGHFTADRQEEISSGSSARVELLPCGHARKVPRFDGDRRNAQINFKELEREIEVYHALTGVRNILAPVEYSPTQGIILPEARRGKLRIYLEFCDAQLTLVQRLQWAVAVAETVHSLHERGVVHCDLNPDNILLDDDVTPYLIDFGGSGVNGKEGAALEGARFFLPRSTRASSTKPTDIFALGSTIYEIMTSQQPYPLLDEEEVEELFAKGDFPSTQHLTGGEIIRQCWTGDLMSAKEVYVALLRCLPLRYAVVYRIHAWLYRCRTALSRS